MCSTNYPESIAPFIRTHLYYDRRQEKGVDQTQKFWATITICRYLVNKTAGDPNDVIEAKIELSTITGNYFVRCGDVDLSREEWERSYDLKKVIQSEKEAWELVFSWIKEKRLKICFEK